MSCRDRDSIRAIWSSSEGGIPFESWPGSGSWSESGLLSSLFLRPPLERVTGFSELDTPFGHDWRGNTGGIDLEDS